MHLYDTGKPDIINIKEKRKMFMRKRLISLVLCLTMVMAALTGCGGNSDSGENPTGTADAGTTPSGSSGEVVFRVGYSTEPPSFDPADFNSTACTLACYDCYDTLLNFNDEGTELLPGIAESWEQIDELTYSYKIREGVKFSDGSDLTMEDVLYSMERVLDADESYSMSYLFESVESFEIDGWNLIVHLSKADSTWKYVPATSPCTIVSKAACEAAGDNYGTIDGPCVGTGPYVKQSWTSGTEIVLVKNEYWWGGVENLAIDKVIISIISDDTARALAAQSGQLDYVRMITSEVLDIYQGASQFDFVVYPATSSNFLAFNCAKEPFNDVNARRAVAYCIDKEAITKAIGGEYATVSKGVPMPSTMYYMDEDAWNYANENTIEDYAQDYDKARECLAASAYPDGFEFDYYCTASGVQQAEAIQYMVSQIGITMNIHEILNSESFGISYGYTLDENGDRVYDMLGTGWLSDYLDPIGYLKPHWHSASIYPGGCNKAVYSNAEVDALLDQTYAITDDKERAALMIKACEIAASEVPYVTLYERQDNYVINKAFTHSEGPSFFWNFSYSEIGVK